MKTLFKVIALVGIASSIMNNKNPQLPRYWIPNEEKPKPKKLITSFGNGKNKFVFQTEFGEIEIFADTQKAADKKLITVNGMNQEIANNNWSIK